jgi:indolepyruvate ferredoxin oxidoreductase alpha subunit
VQFAAGYPGTPSTEIIQYLAKEAKGLTTHVEWSSNEKVAVEAAVAAAFAGLYSLASMKNAGLSVAIDFITHLALTGLGDSGGSLVIVVCDDPAAHSSGDETDSRWLGKFSGLPVLEPTEVAEARDMVKWAFEISKSFKIPLMLRSYTRLSHASSAVQMGDVPKAQRRAHSNTTQCLSPYLALPKHDALLEKLAQVKDRFEIAPYNTYEGPPKPGLLIVCGGSGYKCSTEAVEMLGLQGSVGILKLATIWPFPVKLFQEWLQKTDKVLIAEEVDPFIETHVKEAIVDGIENRKMVHGKASGHIPYVGEISQDSVCAALGKEFSLNYLSRTPQYEESLSKVADALMISRGLTWCPGCPHRASFWVLEKAVKSDGRDAMVTGDIGCYCLDVFPEGKQQMKALHAMGSSTGLATGFGALKPFGYRQPVISICGDGTFFHASIPGLINALHNKSDMVLVVLDNGATAMTGFQSHPDTETTAAGDPTSTLDIRKICMALGCSVTVSDPFNVRETIKKFRAILKKEEGVHVLILKRRCEILRMKQDRTQSFHVRVNDEKCKGEKCGICTGEFRCPGLAQDLDSGKATIQEHVCVGCGVCSEICPFRAIERQVIE